MNEEIIQELKEIKNLLQVIEINRNKDKRSVEEEIKQVIKSDEDYYYKMIKEVTEIFKDNFGVHPDQISLLATAENILPQLYINLL